MRARIQLLVFRLPRRVSSSGWVVEAGLRGRAAGGTRSMPEGGPRRRGAPTQITCFVDHFNKTRMMMDREERGWWRARPAGYKVENGHGGHVTHVPWKPAAGVMSRRGSDSGVWSLQTTGMNNSGRVARPHLARPAAVGAGPD